MLKKAPEMVCMPGSSRAQGFERLGLKVPITSIDTLRHELKDGKPSCSVRAGGLLCQPQGSPRIAVDHRIQSTFQRRSLVEGRFQELVHFQPEILEVLHDSKITRFRIL